MDYVDIKIFNSTKTALVVGNSKFCSITDFRITEEDLDKSYQELTEREDVKRHCLRKLKGLLERDEVILYRTDDSYLLRYLRYAKFDWRRAYCSIRKFYSARLQHPEIFSLPSNLETLLRYGFLTFLPYRDQDGRIVSITDLRKWNAEEISFREVLNVITAIFDIIYMNPHSQISGTLGIWDLRGTSWRQLVQILHPATRVPAAKLLEECYPVRSKMLIAIHCNAVEKTAYSALRCLVKKKIQDRIKFLGSDMTQLHQYVNPAILPKEYGGSLEENEFSTADLIMNNLPYLKYERSFGEKSICKTHPTFQMQEML